MALSPTQILTHYERRFPTQDKLRFDKKDESLLEEIVQKTGLAGPDKSYLTASETWKTKEQGRKEVMHAYATFYSKTYSGDLLTSAQEIMDLSADASELPQHIGHITKVLTALRRLRVMERLECLGRDLRKGDLNSAGKIYQTLLPIDEPAANFALDLLRDYRRAHAPPTAESTPKQTY